MNNFGQAKNDFLLLKNYLEEKDKSHADDQLEKLIERQADYQKTQKPTLKSVLNGELYQDKKTYQRGLKIPYDFDPENTYVFIEISVGKRTPERIEIELFSKICPRTCLNFEKICVGDSFDNDGNQLTFKDSTFHKFVKDSFMQGGDITKKNGSGGWSIYGPSFEDENFCYNHDETYLLSMANTGKNTNRSQFMIAFEELHHFDGKNVVFGRIKEGRDFLDILKTLPAMDGDKPRLDFRIVDCGLSAYKK